MISTEMHCTIAKSPRYLKDFHGRLTTFSGNPRFASLGSAQDLHHHDDTHVFPVFSTWLAIENGCGHISVHKTKTNSTRKLAQNISMYWTGKHYIN